MFDWEKETIEKMESITFDNQLSMTGMHPHWEVYDAEE